MTRGDFEAKAVREAERKLGVPPGWRGTYRDVFDKRERIRVKFSGWCWTVFKREVALVPDGEGWARSVPGKWIAVSKHDSRTYAIAKARKR